MMEIEAAKGFAETHFPYGPEKLAEKLGIEVCEGPLTGCDGWVLSGPAGMLIRLNSADPAKRRRFTLAHELAHLLLGVPTIVGESVYESLKSDNNEERKVNDLASELLLPESIVQRYFPSPPVVGVQLQKFAQKANVSPLAAATRVANIAASIGLMNGLVASFKNDHLEWQWSNKTLTMSPSEALSFLNKAKNSFPDPARILQVETHDVVVASFLKTGVNSAILFIQLLPVEIGNQLSPVERRGQLESYLFKDDNQFRMELQGVLSAFRQCASSATEVAVAEFYRQKGQRWDGSRRVRLNSTKGREYIRLRLGEWCST
jgi:hypothetical protein